MWKLSAWKKITASMVWKRSRRFSISVKQYQKLKNSYVCGPGDVPLQGVTIGQLVDDAANKWGDTEATVVVHQNIRKTFQEFHKDIDQFAAGLVACGLKRGDRIGIWGPNTYEWLLTQFGAARAGLILVNINPAYQPRELEYCLNKVGIKALVASEHFKTQDYYKFLAEVAPEIENSTAGALKSKNIPSMSVVIMISEKLYPGTFTFKSVTEAGGSKDLEYVHDLQRKIQFDEPCNIQFTSGTTGNPKGVTLSHHNVVNNAFLVGRRIGYSDQYHRICVPVPLYHCFGCVISSLNAVIHGAACIYPSPSFNAKAALEAAEKERCTSLYGTPTMFVDMVQVQDEFQLNLSSLSTGGMAGSPCPQELMRKVMVHLNMKYVTVFYGMTETSPVTFQSFPDDSPEIRLSTIGYPQDHTEVKVIDTEGNILPVGTPGELCTRGYTSMLGYWNDEEKTREIISPDRWLHTGDTCVISENGYGQIVGRIKDMLIRGGENIYPREIEDFLLTHPKILEIQVIGVPDERLGEEVCAWVRVKPGETLEEQEIRDYCKGRIAHFKIPKYMIFKDSFPMTVTGKIQKCKMREESIKILTSKD